MKVYSDTLTERDLRDALPRGIGADIHAIRRARVRARGWNVSLEDVSSNRWTNSGTSGAGEGRAASFDSHGEWMAKLFAIDPNARISWWKNAADFERGTEGKYTEGVTA